MKGWAVGKAASKTRMLVVVCTAVILLVAALAGLSLQAHGVESSSSTASTVSSSASSKTESSAAESATSESAATESSAASASSSSAETASSSSSSSTATSEGPASVPTTNDEEEAGSFKNAVAAEVEEALSRHAVPGNRYLRPIEGVSADTGGSVFTFVSPLSNTEIPGDLYWLGNNAELLDSRVGNDVMAASFQMHMTDSDIAGDVRIAGQSVQLSDAVIAGNVDVGALEVLIDGQSAANGYYIGAGTISFEGAAKRFIAYGQSIYFNGVVDGDVTLSAQEIIIGPNAKISGLLDIRSGQNLQTLDIPAGAQIARIDTNLDHPNTIDQITQIRAAIAPYFQVGSVLFIVVSFILLGLAALWGFGPKLTEANRLVRRYPLAVLVLGCIALMFMFVIIMIGTLLIFTIPLSIIVALVVIIAIIFCVPFTGSSLALMLRNRFKPAICVILGCTIGAMLLFVPYVNMLVLVASLIYFVGYMVNIVMFGHDERHDASFHARQADEDAPRGKASGILPVAETGSSSDFADGVASDYDEPAIDFTLDEDEMKASDGEDESDESEAELTDVPRSPVADSPDDGE